jgi:hypothetical protein
MAEPLMTRRRQQTAFERIAWVGVAACGETGVATRTGGTQAAPGVWRRARGDSPVRNRRDPTRRPTSGEGGAYKPKVKWRRGGRESEGFILPLRLRKRGGGKGPCFGYACGWG